MEQRYEHAERRISTKGLPGPSVRLIQETIEIFQRSGWELVTSIQGFLSEDEPMTVLWFKRPFESEPDES